MAVKAPDIDRAQAALDYASHFVDELTARGVSNCVICPGSRSTPLTLSVAGQSAIKPWMQVDERSAAFFALGIAKGLREPVALICTSGTAAANFLPAVVEAHQSGVPLLVLTADRPPELRDTGALQAIDQSNLYGVYAKWFFEMALSDETVDSRRLAHWVAREAVDRAQTAPAGPVHINFPFREPLVPLASISERRRPPKVGERTLHTRRTLPPEEVSHLAAQLKSAERGLIVCGPQDDPALASSVSALAGALGFPILADPLSQLRGSVPFEDERRSHPPVVIANYDLFLRDTEQRRRLEPDIVLRFGLTPTSKALTTFLSSARRGRQISIVPIGLPNDPARSTSETIDADPAWLTVALVKSITDGSNDTSAWLEEWHRVSRTTSVTVDAHLAAIDQLSEPKVFSLLAGCVPSNSLLFVGNSMPVRDLDGFFPVRRDPVRILGNRGVNGIDGIVSTALGAAAGSGRRVVLVIGDLSFYHDMNGLLAAKLHRIDATIVLLNNDGGGIFHFLPQAQHPKTLEPYFSVPIGLDYRQAVEMYGGRFRRPTGWDELRHDLVDSWTVPGLTVIEVRTERDSNVTQHRIIWDAVAEALRTLAVDT